MAEERLKLEPEVQEVFKCIDANTDFLLSGGAGSGKTFSLVATIRQTIAENPTARIACMTFTNAAVKEIEERIGHKNLSVSTIHDFLWDNIKHFQKELKAALVTLINDPGEEGITINVAKPAPEDLFHNLEDGIQYKEYLQLSNGIISHNELLIVAQYMFKKHAKLCDIVKDKFQFIYIDEYQDTNHRVVSIFLEHFDQSNRKSIVGFFGDAMQAIYDDGIGDLNAYTANGRVKEIKKSQNRRNPKLVIDLANKLRTDGITQVSSVDSAAPNMADGSVKMGVVKFLHSANPNLQAVRDYLSREFGWDFTDAKTTKELNLTHNLIAGKAGFQSLMEIYDKDRILELKGKIVKKIKDDGIEIDPSATFGDVIDKVNLSIGQTTVIGRFLAENAGLYQKARSYPFSDFKNVYADKDHLVDDKKQDEDDESRGNSKRDNLVAHLFKIQKAIHLYKSKRYNEFIRITDFAISNAADKKSLQEDVGELINVDGKTIEEVITLADAKGFCRIDDHLARFKKQNEYVYDRVKAVGFQEFQKLYDYLEGHTPFSTQHKVKGAEFDDVLVVLDNGAWNKYNFGNLFLKAGNENVLSRTQKIFYVCCTRAKENLAVFFHQPPAGVIEKAADWFGPENVVSLP